MKRALIFINGKRISKKRVLEVLKNTDTILCADGGIKHVLAYGLIPTIVIGDQDSLSTITKKKIGKDVMFITHPREKDFTDSELTIEYAIEHGFDEICVFGINGSRLDHVLANIFYLSFHTKQRMITIIEEYQTIHVLKKGVLKLTGKKGQKVSLVPLTDTVSPVKTTGLKWALNSQALEFGKTRGVSNELTGRSASIMLKRGPLIVIHSLKAL